MRQKNIADLKSKGFKLIEEDKYLDAFSCLSEVFVEDPTDGEVSQALIFLFDRIQSGNYDFTPSTSSEFIARGITRFYHQEFEASIRDYDRALQLESKNAYALKCKAFSLKFLGQHKNAIQNLKAALEIEQKGEYYDDIAENYKNLGDYTNALKYNKLAVETTPNDPRLHYNYGYHLAEVRQLKSAIIQFRKALQLQPNYADAKQALAFCLAQTKG